MENPIVGLIMGSIFGACLVLSGLTDPDKIIGSLRLKDFHAIRTIAVFLLVGMFGTWLLELVGAANVNIKPAAIFTVLIGGSFIGIGLGLTGFSPGTGLACAASGRIDALATVSGMFLGAHAYVLIYPSTIIPLEKIANMGKVTLPQITGSSMTSWIIPICATGSLALFLTRSGKRQDIKQYNNVGDKKMSEDLFDPMSPIPIPRIKDTYIKNDLLKAIRFTRRCKIFLFTLIVLCLLLLQTSFWLVHNQSIELNENKSINSPVVIANNVKQPDAVVKQNGIAANQLIRSTIEGQEKSQGTLKFFNVEITFERISSIISITNVTLLLSSVLYSLIMYCGLGYSIGGNLGGLSHISRACIYSLIMLILLLPWQCLFASTILGAIYTPRELSMWCKPGITNTFSTILLYLRFTGYSTVIIILLLLAQIRDLLWSKAIVHRLN